MISLFAMLECLYLPFVLFGSLKAGKGSEVPPLACLCIRFARVNAVLARFEFTYHVIFFTKPPQTACRGDTRNEGHKTNVSDELKASDFKRSA